jgi:hypothetical protein
MFAEVSMKTYRWLKRRRRILGAMMLLAALASTSATAAAAPASCDMLLTVELWPDVPDASDAGFLSSLLSNHVSYRLTLRQQRTRTAVVLDLTGPGPDYRCENVVEAMRKDGRVLSVHVYQENPYRTGLENADEMRGVAVVAAPLYSEETPPAHLSGSGFGSLYWAAQHADQAWRVLFPIQSGDASGASANIRTSCVVFPGSPNDEAPC